MTISTLISPQNLITTGIFSSEIMKITSDESSDEFFAFLDRPQWFKDAIRSEFDSHRRDGGGIIFLKSKNGKISGSIYLEMNPLHYSLGNITPIFGWLQGDTYEDVQILLRTIEILCRSEGKSYIRGPINPPDMFGGWGALIEGFELGYLVDTPMNEPRLGSMIEEAGYLPDADYNILKVKNLPRFAPAFKTQNIELFTRPIKEILEDRSFLIELRAFTQKNFKTFLPDSSPNKMEKILDLLSRVEHGDKYLWFGREKSTGRIIALLCQVPNVMEMVQGLPITKTDFNIVIIAKEYRHKYLGYSLYAKSNKGLRSIGVKTNFGTAVWSENRTAMKSFKHATKLVGVSRVYKKNLWQHYYGAFC